MSEIRVEKLIRRLLQGRTDAKKSPIKLDVNELNWLCGECVKILENETSLIKIDAPVTIIGDLHGQFFDLLQFIDLGDFPSNTQYLFLGNYINKGKNSVETLTLLLAYKVRFPEQVWLLRGNHETLEMARSQGFFHECASKYSQEMWSKFITVFKYLPIAAIVSDRIFCVHSGLSPLLNDLSQISQLKKPMDVGDSGLVHDLLSSQPSKANNGFCETEKGVSYGMDVVDEFLKKYGFDLMIRGNQLVDPGFKFPFMPNKCLLTLFSAPDFCNKFGNRGGMLRVDFDLKCTFFYVDPPPLNKNRLKFSSYSPNNDFSKDYATNYK